MPEHKLWQMLNELQSPAYRWVELSHEVSENTPHHEVFPALSTKNILTFEKANVSSIAYTLVSQYGTHIDPPCHFIQGGRALHEFNAKELVLPLCLLDFSNQAQANPDFTLTVDNIKVWESQHGQIPQGAFVAMRTDWSKRPNNDFDNKDAHGDSHFPGWSLEALKFLCEQRGVGAIGHETSDTDPAYTQKTALWAGELYYLKQDRFQVEILKNLDLLPATGAIIFCIVPLVKDAPGFTARCFAICPNNNYEGH